MSKKTYTITSFYGAPPGDQEASYWTEEDWQKYYAHVDELKANGLYGKPITLTYHFETYDLFDNVKPFNPFENATLLIPSGLTGGKPIEIKLQNPDTDKPDDAP